MSHITKSTANTRFNNRDRLIKALSAHGKVEENGKHYRVGAGFTTERYDVMFISRQNDKLRIGYNPEEVTVDGQKETQWTPFEENYGSHGDWTEKMSTTISDHYTALEHIDALEEQGFNATLTQKQNGAFEISFEEGW